MVQIVKIFMSLFWLQLDIILWVSVYANEGYKLYFSTIHRNQNDGVFVFVGNNYNIDFFKYDFVEANIVKLSIINLGIPMNLLCIYKSLATDINNFNNTSSKIKWENKNKNIFTLLIGDTINIIGDSEFNDDYLNLLSENSFSSFINYTNCQWNKALMSWSYVCPQ